MEIKPRVNQPAWHGLDPRLIGGTMWIVMIMGLKLFGTGHERTSMNVSIPAAMPDAATLAGMLPTPLPREHAHRGERYREVNEPGYRDTEARPTIEVGVDVDTASWSNVRRYMRNWMKPPRDAVRIEEMVNAFTYQNAWSEYPGLNGPRTFKMNASSVICPWNEDHRLVRIAVKARSVDDGPRPPVNLVMLLDVSGSMGSYWRLPMVRDALKQLVGRLDDRDRIAIVTYADEARVALPSTPADQAVKIIDALDGLQIGGGTDGGVGLDEAYRIATRNFIEGGANRVLLASDGDFNQGRIADNQLVRLIEKGARSGVRLTVIGVGSGNYNDRTLGRLARSGQGQFVYLDSFEEAHEVLVDGVGGTLITVASDVTLSVKFDPRLVESYRLIGYDDRIKPRDTTLGEFDGGGIGAGHSANILFEIVPRPQIRNEIPAKLVDQYGTGLVGYLQIGTATVWYHDELNRSREGVETMILDDARPIQRSGPDQRLSAAVTAFGMLLRDSPHKGEATPELIESLLEQDGGVTHSEEYRELLGLTMRLKHLRSP